jgi:hypothetical protein
MIPKIGLKGADISPARLKATSLNSLQRCFAIHFIKPPLAREPGSCEYKTAFRKTEPSSISF